MGIKEQVKSGQLTPQEAMAKVSKDSHTYGWYKRRGNKNYGPIGVAPAVEAAPASKASDEKAKSKYRQKKHSKGKFKTI